MNAAWYRRLFLRTLAVVAVLLAIPLTVFALWFGFQGPHGATDRQAFCRVPYDLDLLRLQQEELDLRRRAGTLEGDISRRHAACPLCVPPPEMDIALVMDTSLSMKWPASLDAEAEKALMERLVRESGPTNTPAGNRRFLDELERTPAGQERFEAARRIALTAVGSLTSNARVRLLSFRTVDPARTAETACKIVDRGAFDSTGRAGLEAALRNLKPDAAGTPLAKGISAGAAAVKARAPGVRGVVVVVTDGAESCRGDPCAAATAAKNGDPELSIILIDIAGNRQAACVAGGPIGGVFSRTANVDLVRHLEQALRPPQQQSCIPVPPANAANRAQR